MMTRTQFETFDEEARRRGIDLDPAGTACKAYFQARRAVGNVPGPNSPNEVWRLRERLESVHASPTASAEEVSQARGRYREAIEHDQRVKLGKTRALEAMEQARLKAIVAIRELVKEAKKNAVKEANEILGVLPEPVPGLFTPPPKRVRELADLGAWADNRLCLELSIRGFPGNEHVKPEPSFLSLIRPEFVKRALSDNWAMVITT